MVQVLAHEKLAWLLAAFYFLTFGGFVATLFEQVGLEDASALEGVSKEVNLDEAERWAPPLAGPAHRDFRLGVGPVERISP